MRGCGANYCCSGSFDSKAGSVTSREVEGSTMRVAAGVAGSQLILQACAAVSEFLQSTKANTKEIDHTSVTHVQRSSPQETLLSREQIESCEKGWFLVIDPLDAGTGSPGKFVGHLENFGSCEFSGVFDGDMDNLDFPEALVESGDFSKTCAHEAPVGVGVDRAVEDERAEIEPVGSVEVIFLELFILMLRRKKVWRVRSDQRLGFPEEDVENLLLE
jgi:hypothetical protein